jgi:hypothetical protein
MSQLTPDQVLAIPATELAQRTSDSLFQLKNSTAELLAAAKTIAEHVDRALNLKYAERAHQVRLAAGKDTGTVHFDDGQVRIMLGPLQKRTRLASKMASGKSRRQPYPGAGTTSRDAGRPAQSIPATRQCADGARAGRARTLAARPPARVRSANNCEFSRACRSRA